MIAMHEDKALIIGQVVLFLTTLAGFFFQLFREGRNRKWDLQDRALARVAATKDAEEVKDKLDKAEIKATNERKQIAESVTTQIKENTEISTKAFEEANHVNLKIVDLKKDTLAVHQRIEDLIRVFDVAGKPEVKVEAKMDEHVTLDKKLEGHAEQ